jgi:hypothetical protein
MIKRTTYSDLLLYAYNETGLCDSDRIQRAVDSDPVIAGDFQEVIEFMGMLDEARPAVSPQALARILDAARV